MRSGAGPVAAWCRRRAAWHAGHSFSLKFFVRVVTLGEARHECFSQCDAGGDAVGLQVGNVAKRLISVG